MELLAKPGLFKIAVLWEPGTGCRVCVCVCVCVCVYTFLLGGAVEKGGCIQSALNVSALQKNKCSQD